MPTDFNHPRLKLSAHQLEILDDLLESWEELEKRGIAPDPVDHCREYPELLPALLSQLKALKDTAWLDEPPGSVAAGPDELAAGLELIPGYRLLERLGSGGFGTVWRAMGPGGVKVALKCLWMGEQKSSHEWKGLANLKELRHPHLLGLFGLWVSRGWFVVGSELADETLANWQSQENGNLVKPKPEPVRRLLEHLREAAEALDFLHQQVPPLVHGDVKPENLLLVGGRCKVGDFGLLRRVVQGDLPRDEGVTLAYAAPEMLLGKPRPASDQYALALTFCHLRGCFPFSQRGLGLAQAHLSATPDLSGLTRREAEVISRALSKQPEERYPTCIALIQALVKTTADPLNRAQWRLTRVGKVFKRLLIASCFAAIAVAAFATFPRSSPLEQLSPVLVQPTRMVGGAKPAKTNTVLLRIEKPDQMLAVEDGGTVCRWLVSKGLWESKPVATHRLWASLEMVPGENHAVGGQGIEPFLVQEWDTSTGRIVREYPGHKGLVRGLAVSEDGALVASVSHQGAIQVNRRADGASVVRFVQEKKEFNAVKFTAQGDGLLVVSGDGRVLFHRLGEKEMRTLHFQKGVQFWSLVRLPGTSRFLVGGTDGRLLEVDPAKSVPVRTLLEIGQAITELAVNADSGLVLVGTGQIKSTLPGGDWDEPGQYPLILVNPAEGKVLGRFEGHKAIIRSLAWSNDGRKAFSSSLDGVDYCWTVLGRMPRKN